MSWHEGIKSRKGFFCHYAVIWYTPHMSVSSGVQKADEMSLAYDVAFRTAWIVSACYAGIFLLWQLSPFLANVYVLLVTKTMTVILVIRFSVGKIMQLKEVEYTGSFSILSSVFFYGITLLILYSAQILYVLQNIFFGDWKSFGDAIHFLFWVSDFSVSTLFWTFVIAHIPYLAYYWVVRAYSNRLSR